MTTAWARCAAWWWRAATGGGGCCSNKVAVETYGDGMNGRGGAFARKIAFELFVMEILDRDGGIELVTA
jgi:hypothetical protein